MLKRISALKIPTTVCTMYNPNFENAQQQRMCETGLCVLNDVIITESTKVFILFYRIKLLNDFYFMIAWYSCY